MRPWTPVSTSWRPCAACSAWATVPARAGSASGGRPRCCPRALEAPAGGTRWSIWSASSRGAGGRSGERLMRAELLVVGAGPAGLATAARLAEDGHQVRLLARGNGFTHWGAGAIDVLGRAGERRVERPLEAIGELPAD